MAASSTGLLSSSRKAKRLKLTPRSTPVWAKRPISSTPISAGRPLKRLSFTPRGFTPRGFTPRGFTPRGFTLSTDDVQSSSVDRAVLRLTADETARKRERQRVKQTREQLKQCEELTGGSWRLYSVSLLYNLQRMIDSVQLYSRSLTAHTKAGMGRQEQAVFAGETEEGDEDSGGMETVAKAVITVMTGIKSFVSDQSAIRITVNGKKSTGKEAVLLKVVLCGCGASSEDEISKFAALPLLLCNGRLSIARHVFDWLQVTFDCRISKLQIPSQHLAYLVANWTRYATGERSCMELYFSPKQHVIDKGLKQITLSVEQDVAKTLLKSIRSDMNSELTDDEAERFFKALAAHLYSVFQIRVETLALTRVTSSIAKVSKDGSLTMFNGRHILQILEFLTDIIGR